MTSFNRIAAPADFDVQTPKDLHPLVTPEILAGQHPQRAWEYSQALKALDEWLHSVRPMCDFKPENQLLLADIGGSSSNFWKTLTEYTRKPITGVDPNHTWTSDDQAALYFRQTLRNYVLNANPEWLPAFDAVFCLSVIEHVPSKDLPQFEQDLCSLVRPGGLLVLTTDAGESHPDVFHFNWMRERIYTAAGLAALHVVFAGTHNMQALTPPDYHYDGPTVYDYSVAILSFVKKG